MKTLSAVLIWNNLKEETKNIPTTRSSPMKSHGYFASFPIHDNSHMKTRIHHISRLNLLSFLLIFVGFNVKYHIHWSCRAKRLKKYLQTFKLKALFIYFLFISSFLVAKICWKRSLSNKNVVLLAGELAAFSFTEFVIYLNSFTKN